MANARKTKSGRWRVLAYDYTDSQGKRHYKSYTAATKKQAEMLAIRDRLDKKEKECTPITFGDALTNYIELRTPVLSPTTIRGYKTLQRTRLLPLSAVLVQDLTQLKLQHFINSLVGVVSPKTVSNIHGLIVAVVHSVDANINYNTILPQRVRPALTIPTDDDIRQLLQLAADTRLEIPILLASFGTMRRGEICALTAEDVRGTVAHINKSMAMSINGDFIIKPPKTVGSDRFVELPQFVIDKLPKSGKITDLTPTMLTNEFKRFIRRNRLQHFRFHDLRHYSASIMHALGVPDKYIMERGGWSTDKTLKSVYQHTMADQAEHYNKKIQSHFEKMQRKMQHKEIEPSK